MAGQYRYIPPSPSAQFTAGVVGGFGALLGFLTAQGNFGLMLPYLIVGAVIFAAVALGLRHFNPSRFVAGLVTAILFFVIGTLLISFPYGVLMLPIGWIIGRMSLWLHSGDYRLNLPPYATSREVLWLYTFRTICGAIFVRNV